MKQVLEILVSKSLVSFSMLSTGFLHVDYGRLYHVFRSFYKLFAYHLFC